VNHQGTPDYNRLNSLRTKSYNQLDARILGRRLGIARLEQRQRRAALTAGQQQRER